ncbi:terpenoid synthase [Infundibulicybe gibba]|nr:terpenoid synthase [Infundibulicybe gibba]
MGYIITTPQIHSQTSSSDHFTENDVAKPDPNAYIIPDLLRNWPWPRRLNPHYSVCNAESTAWCEALGAFNSPESQDALNRCASGLLGALTYPLLDKVNCRIGCDLIHLYFILDEYTDIADPISVRHQADIVMDALHHPHTARPAGEWIGGEATRQFWENTIRTASPAFQRRFKDGFKIYTDGVVQQAKDRVQNHVRDIEGYFTLRRDASGMVPCFDLCAIHMDLPDHVLADPAIQKLTLACLDLVIVANDLYSYNVEQAVGEDGHNLVRVVMHEQGSTLEEAVAWISRLNDELVEVFLEEYERVPTQWGSPTLDAHVAEYILGIAYWLRGNEAWSYEGERYFGKEGLEVKRTGVVKIMPSTGESSAAN